MLSFRQNGEEIRIFPIHDNGQVGQKVIFGERVNWGENPDLIKNPLPKYACPSIFTIMAKCEEENGDKNGYYILQDANGNSFRLRYKDCVYLYDAQKWITWNCKAQESEISRKNEMIAQLEGQVQLLKEILIKQGSRIVTEKQAKDLGL